MRMWRELALEAVTADMRRLADAGATSVRVFLRWEDFQPEPDRVDRGRLRDLATIADGAASNGLRLMPTLFTGHMSGANWLPRWATRPGGRGRFPVVCADAYAEVEPRSWFA